VRPGPAGAGRGRACQRLGQRHDVGPHAGVLVRPQAAGAAQAALHLVEHQQRARVVAQPPQARQEVSAGGEDAALALQRLHKHAGRAPLRQARRIGGAAAPTRCRGAALLCTSGRAMGLPMTAYILCLPCLSRSACLPYGIMPCLQSP